MHLRERRCDVDMSPAPGSWRRVLTLALLAGAAVPGGHLPSLYKSQIFDGSTTTLSFEHGVWPASCCMRSIILLAASTPTA